MHSCRKKNQCQTWFSYKSCKIFGSHSAKCLTYIFLYKNTELKNIRLSSIPDAYYIADSKSMKGARYNSVLTCSLLVTNLYFFSTEDVLFQTLTSAVRFMASKWITATSMLLALIPRAHTTALAILPILGMVLHVKVSLYKYLIRGGINPCHLIR